ncbi:MAG: hypothetical protein LBC96_05780 [Lachnospiraceae bacterium]|jgi:hypothetical protein|nr:hypothetical protein [Lachnospiraceae bacterium]
MASKFTKLVFLTAVAAAVGAGVYYYVQKKNAENADADLDGSDDDTVAEGRKGRSYVSLGIDNVECALQKAKEKISGSYHHVRDSVKAGLAQGGVIRDFTDLSRDEDEEGVEVDSETESEANEE